MNMPKPPKNSFLQVGLLALGVCFAVQNCLAQSNTIVTSVGTIGTQTSSTPRTFGYDFTIGSQPLIINALGFYDWYLQNGNNPPTVAPDVGLWNSSGTLIANTTVSLNSTSLGYFRYQLLPSQVTLSANTTYYLGAFYPSGAVDLTVFLDTGATTDPDVTLGDGAYSTASTMSFPGTTSSGYDAGFFGPNATYLAPVPEPSFYSLMSVTGGLMGIFYWCRNRKRCLLR